MGVAPAAAVSHCGGAASCQGSHRKRRGPRPRTAGPIARRRGTYIPASFGDIAAEVVVPFRPSLRPLLLVFRQLGESGSPSLVACRGSRAGSIQARGCLRAADLPPPVLADVPHPALLRHLKEGRIQRALGVLARWRASDALEMLQDLGGMDRRAALVSQKALDCRCGGPLTRASRPRPPLAPSCCRTAPATAIATSTAAAACKGTQGFDGSVQGGPLGLKVAERRGRALTFRE